jgi:drug/metabolite transporter (DMT)-like permease
MSREWLGFLLVAFSAVSLGSTPSVARLAQAGGASPEAVALARCVAAAGLAALVLAWRCRRWPRVARAELGAYLFVAAMLGVQSFVYPAAVMLIPVSVAVVTFFLFPALVGLFGWVILGERLTGIRLAGLVLGFVGVALTVGAAPRSLAPLGLGFAFAAAVATALSIVYGARLMRRSGLLDFTVVGQALAGLLVGLGAAAATAAGAAPPALPTTGLGWLGLSLSGLLFAVGILAFFGAITVVDAVRAATVANLEPLWAIVLAMLLFGEALAGAQWLGAALVIGAVLLGPLFDRARAG